LIIHIIFYHHFYHLIYYFMDLRLIIICCFYMGFKILLESIMRFLEIFLCLGLRGIKLLGFRTISIGGGFLFGLLVCCCCEWIGNVCRMGSKHFDRNFYSSLSYICKIDHLYFSFKFPHVQKYTTNKKIKKPHSQKDKLD